MAKKIVLRVAHHGRILQSKIPRLSMFLKISGLSMFLKISGLSMFLKIPGLSMFFLKRFFDLVCF